MGVDPDGRFVFAPIIMGAMIGAFMGGVQADRSGQNVFKGILVGGLTGAIGGAASVLAPAGILPGVLYGAGTGAAIGAGQAALTGGNVGQAALWGAAIGGVAGGINGGVTVARGGGNIWTGEFPTRDFTIEDLQAVGGSISDSPQEYSDKAMKAFRQKHFANAKGYLSRGIPNGYKIDSDGSWIKLETGQTGILGTTRPTIWGGGRLGSNIYISRKAFSSSRDLFITMGHEFTHAQHYLAGLHLKFPNGDGASYFDFEGMSERGAWEWTLEAGRANKWSSWIQDAKQVLSTPQGYPYTVPSIFRSQINTIFIK